MHALNILTAYMLSNIALNPHKLATGQTWRKRVNVYFKYGFSRQQNVRVYGVEHSYVSDS